MATTHAPASGVQQLPSVTPSALLAASTLAEGAKAGTGLGDGSGDSMLGRGGAAAVHLSVLGSSLALHEIKQVRMHIAGTCKASISFWPTFRFKAPDREPEAGTVSMVHAPPGSDAAPAPAPAGSPAGAAAPGRGSSRQPEAATPADSSPGGQQSLQQQLGADADTSGAAARPEAGGQGGDPATPAAAAAAAPGPPAAAAPAAVVSGRELLHISFTRDPPDEFNMGAHALGCIPFPFITIRTNRLEGTLDPVTSAMTLLFDASFVTQVGKREPTSLAINATLTTEAATAFKTTLRGERLAGGRGVLVSAAEVPKTPNWFANLLLWLPTAAIAVLPIRLEFLP